jgi:hypothetical protein
MQVKIILTKDFAHLKAGDDLSICSMTASQIVRDGFAKYPSKTPVKDSTKKQVKK